MFTVTMIFLNLRKNNKLSSSLEEPAHIGRNPRITGETQRILEHPLPITQKKLDPFI